MTTLAAVRNEIKANLTIGGTVKDAAIDGYIRTELRNMRQKRFWFLRSRTNLDLSAGASSVSLPADFSVLEQVDMIYNTTRYTNGNGFDIVTYRVFTERFLNEQNAQQGIPAAVTQFANQLLVDRAPSIGATLELVYYKQDETLPTSDNDTSLWFDDGFNYIRALAQYHFEKFNLGNAGASSEEALQFKRTLDNQEQFRDRGGYW